MTNGNASGTPGQENDDEPDEKFRGPGWLKRAASFEQVQQQAERDEWLARMGLIRRERLAYTLKRDDAVVLALEAFGLKAGGTPKAKLYRMDSVADAVEAEYRHAITEGATDGDAEAG